jgi:hypothetical protein
VVIFGVRFMVGSVDEVVDDSGAVQFVAMDCCGDGEGRPLLGSVDYVNWHFR